MIQTVFKTLTGIFNTFRRSILIALLLALLIFIMVEYVLPLRECRETEVIMTALADENNLLKLTCESEKFEDKWANIARDYNNQNKKKDLNEENNISNNGIGGTIIF